MECVTARVRLAAVCVRVWPQGVVGSFCEMGWREVTASCRRG